MDSVVAADFSLQTDVAAQLVSHPQATTGGVLP
jgi:hypothetical protein